MAKNAESPGRSKPSKNTPVVKEGLLLPNKEFVFTAFFFLTRHPQQEHCVDHPLAGGAGETLQGPGEAARKRRRQRRRRAGLFRPIVRLLAKPISALCH